MKKLAMILIAGLAVAGVAYAQTTITNRGEVFEVTLMDDVEKSTETTTQPDEIVEDLTVEGDATVAGTLAVASSDVVTEATLYQVDTNVTTTATAYTPDFIGQVLIGGAGAGTNGVWIAKGVTTNDWVVVAP